MLIIERRYIYLVNNFGQGVRFACRGLPTFWQIYDSSKRFFQPDDDDDQRKVILEMCVCFMRLFLHCLCRPGDLLKTISLMIFRPCTSERVRFLFTFKFLPG